MGTNPASAGQPSAQDLDDAYSELLNHLQAAFFAAATPADKAQINSLIHAVTDVITHLVGADLAKRDAAFTALSNQVTTVNTQLQTVQKQIDGIISRISSAATIIADITKVVSLAAQVFPVA